MKESQASAIRLVLLDRDGVLNEDLARSVRSPGELVMLKGAAEAVAALNKASILVAACTNQAVVGRGLITQKELDIIHAKLHDELHRAGAHLDGVFVCTDLPFEEGGGKSLRRKPAPGMLHEALSRFRVAPANAVMIGDSLSDLQAAQTAGVGRILVRTGKGARTQAEGIDRSLLPVAVHANLAEAVAHLLISGAAKDL